MQQVIDQKYPPIQSQNKRLYPHSLCKTEPRTVFNLWSPNGSYSRRVIFSLRKNGEVDVFAMSVGGREIKALSELWYPNSDGTMAYRLSFIDGDNDQRSRVPIDHARWLWTYLIDFGWQRIPPQS